MNLKTVKICLGLTFMLMLASAAQAAPGDDKGKPGKDGPGGPVPEQLDPEKQELARKLFSDFEMKIEPLRTELHSKNLQFEAFSNSASIDKETIVTLADEIAELNSKLRQEHRAFMDKCREEIGPDAECISRLERKANSGCTAALAEREVPCIPALRCHRPRLMASLSQNPNPNRK